MPTLMNLSWHFRRGMIPISDSVESNSLVVKNREKLAKNRTTFVIAHRLSTIKNAQRILVLTEEGICEEGSHEELMKKRGVYYNLYTLSGNPL